LTESKFGKPADLLKRPQLAKGPAAPQAKGNDGRVTFAPGENLFHQGDPGGDLYFIEQGVVEIYTAKDSEAIVLSEMTQGEIIGVMTCLTSEARMASARAKTPVVCKKVPHASISKVLAALPNWMKIVLKEFTIRLQQMNKSYSEAVQRIKKLEATQISNVYTGAQLAAAFGAVAEYLAIKQEDTKIVVVEDLLAKLEFVLNIKKEEIDRVFAVLLEAGLVKLEIEMEKKRTIVKLENAQKLQYFAQFVRESRHGATKKLVRARFSHKETRVMSAIVKFAQRLDMDMDKTGKLNVLDLEKSRSKAAKAKPSS
jgi:CRP-like cAMP-binding protein